MAETIKLSQQGLTILEEAIRRKGWTKTQTAAFWNSAHTSQGTLRRFWRGVPIQKDTFIAICQAVGIEDWQAIAQVEVSQSYPETVEGSVPLNSSFYVRRPPLEERCYQEILQPGALIRLKAPRKMGKTSLLNRIFNTATRQDYDILRFNLTLAESELFTTLNRFLRWFCIYASEKLHLSSQLQEYWDQDRGSILNCTLYFEMYLLESLDSPLVLALDEVDHVFQFPAIAQSFLAMLRSWHEEAKTSEIWEKLRLIVVHSTEDYGTLDINQSPFNVGLSIELPEFTPEQIQDLAKRYQLEWNQDFVQQLMDMVGGHPYLVRLALSEIAQNGITLENLLQNAPTSSGIYEQHLRRHLCQLQENSALATALQQVVTSSQPVSLETIVAYKLYSMGLIQREGDFVTSRCRLYQQYFQHHLNWEENEEN